MNLEKFCEQPRSDLTTISWLPVSNMKRSLWPSMYRWEYSWSDLGSLSRFILRDFESPVRITESFYCWARLYGFEWLCLIWLIKSVLRYSWFE